MNVKEKSFLIQGKVWRWPGVGGWHFVYVDGTIKEKIKKVAKPYGSGFVKIEASLGKTSWQTALFPHTKENSYLISIKQNVRKKEDVFEGDEVKIKIKLI
ncbi:MAG: hypothetical protein QG551_64 [Patescibacteria group bacterium]|jgi:hypothetical protein|nr:hypothetical protein [Patescibacteria group bacterium]